MILVRKPMPCRWIASKQRLSQIVYIHLPIKPLPVGMTDLFLDLLSCQVDQLSLGHFLMQFVDHCLYLYRNVKIDAAGLNRMLDLNVRFLHDQHSGQ
jgi:hypothetical protein